MGTRIAIIAHHHSTVRAAGSSVTAWPQVRLISPDGFAAVGRADARYDARLTGLLIPSSLQGVAGSSAYFRAAGYSSSRASSPVHVSRCRANALTRPSSPKAMTRALAHQGQVLCSRGVLGERSIYEQ